MIVKVWYDDARLDAFDTQTFSSQRPFGSNAILTNMELRLDGLGEKGLWLTAHYYDADPSYKGDGAGTPVARRKRGWRMLLAEAREVGGIQRVTVDGEDVLLRVGPDLVDMAKLARCDEILLGGQPRGVAAQAFALHGMFSSALGLVPEEAARAFGFSMGSIEWASQLQAGMPEEEPEEEDWGDDDAEDDYPRD